MLLLLFMGASAASSGIGVSEGVPKSKIVNAFYDSHPTYKQDNYSPTIPVKNFHEKQSVNIASKIGDMPWTGTSADTAFKKQEVGNVSQSEWKPVRVTHYTTGEDKYGSKTAKPNYLGVSNAVDKVSAAVDPNLIPYGSWIEVRDRLGKVHKLFAHDTGSAVKAQKASNGKMPVIDIFSKDKNLGSLDKMFEGSQYRIVNPNSL